MPGTQGLRLGFFLVVTTFFPLAVLVDSHRGEPGLRLRCRSTAGPLGCHSSCAGCLLAGVEDWKKAEVGDSPLVRTASRHRTCALVRLSTSSTSDERRATSDERLASMVAAWGLVSVTADLRPDRSDRHVADDLCRLLCSSGAVESEGLSWMRPLWSSLGVDAAGYAAGTATTRPRPPMDHPPSPHGPGMGPSPMSGSRTQGPTISFVRWRSKPALPLVQSRPREKG